LAFNVIIFFKKKKLVGEGDSNPDSHYRDNSTISLNQKTLASLVLVMKKIETNNQILTNGRL
jgi:hypothetical protein